MPKDNSPMSSNNKPDDHSSRLTDIALRKKKNADAQAAFRARRANYISTLEETVTNLESVVLQLQESCREARSEAQELRQDNARLRQALRDRENFWRALWPRKGQGSEADDCPPPFPSSSDQTGFNGLSSSQLPKYPDGGMGYRDDSSMCTNQYPPNSTPHQSPSVSFAGVPGDISTENSALSSRLPAKYTPYFNQVPTTRDANWPQSITQSSSSGGDSGVPAASSHSSNSPHFVESPTLTSSDMSYMGRFHPEEQKVPMNNLDTAPYVFSTSRSISPSSSTPPSSSSTSLTSPFQFSFPEASAVQDRADFDYRRQSTYGAEVTLHGGTADVSLAGSGAEGGVRYRLGPNRRLDGGSDRALLPLLPPLSGGSDNGSQHERGSSDGDSVPYPNSRLRTRRSTAPSRSSRSPSPGLAPLSGTLAVIKAQAFGALRRTRVRSKKSGDGVAKVAMDVLEARGISMGVQAGAKRRRQSDDEDADAL